MFAGYMRDTSSMIDTHAIVKSLIATGFTESQAEAITDAFVSGNHKLEELVTQEQHAAIAQELGLTRQDLVEVKQDIVVIKKDLVEVKQDIIVIKKDLVEVKQRLGAVEQDIVVIKKDLVEVKQDIVVIKKDLVEVKQDIIVIKKDLVSIRQEFGIRMDGMQHQLNDIKHFMVAFFVANMSVMLGILGIIVAVFFKG